MDAGQKLPWSVVACPKQASAIALEEYHAVGMFDLLSIVEMNDSDESHLWTGTGVRASSVELVLNIVSYHPHQESGIRFEYSS